MKLLPFGLAHAFLMAPEKDSQGSGSTGMDFDDAADDALVAEGEAELMDTSEDGEPEPEDDLEAQSEDDEEDPSEDEEDQGEEEDEEGEEEENEEQPEEKKAAGFKFKDPKTGNFDWKRINAVLGDDTLEKAIREQNSTITKYSQRVKELEGVENSPQIVESRNKAGFFDHLMNTHPVIRQEVLKVLHGEQAGQAAGNQQLPPGVDPNDPLAPIVLQLSQTVQSLQNRTQEEQRRQKQMELENRFVQGLHGARAKFKELVGKDASDEQIQLVAAEMQKTGVLEGARFVADLFYTEIQDSIRQRILRENAEKRKKLGPLGSGRKSPPSKGKSKSKEADFDALWDEHIK